MVKRFLNEVVYYQNGKKKAKNMAISPEIYPTNHINPHFQRHSNHQSRNDLLSPFDHVCQLVSTHAYDTEEWIGVYHYTNNTLDEIDDNLLTDFKTFQDFQTSEFSVKKRKTKRLL